MNSSTINPKSNAGFTLIELLVVVTLIVLLLALLTPALDRAVYQAELALCMSHIKTAASGATVYAASFKTRYPVRPTIEKYAVTPVGWLNNGNEAGSDDRAIFRDYIPINASLNCPLDTPAVNIEYAQPTTYTFSSYALWFGFFYTGRQGMRKIGDRFQALEEVTNTAGDYSLLVSDYSVVHRTGGYGYSTHPDDAGLWTKIYTQDTPAPWAVAVGGVAVLYGNAALSYYQGQPNRGTFDMNFGYTDGSVGRVDRVKYAPADEERMHYIAAFSNPATDPGRDLQVPGR